MGNICGDGQKFYVRILDMLLYQVLIVATKIGAIALGSFAAMGSPRVLLSEVSLYNLGGKNTDFATRALVVWRVFIARVFTIVFAATVYPRQTLDFVYRYGGTAREQHNTLA